MRRNPASIVTARPSLLPLGTGCAGGVPWECDSVRFRGDNLITAGIGRAGIIAINNQHPVNHLRLRGLDWKSERCGQQRQGKGECGSDLHNTLFPFLEMNKS